MNALEELKRYTRVVADTGSFELMRRFQPVDATTNPSLILKVVESSQYRPLVRDVLQQSRNQTAEKQLLRLLVQFGLEIVQSVRAIYALYAERGYKTEVMGASFRSIEQVLALAGCDLLTVSPELLEGLMNQRLGKLLEPVLVPRDLSSLQANASAERPLLGESNFRLQVNEDAMATDKLSEGIRLFKRDGDKLRALLGDMA